MEIVARSKAVVRSILGAAYVHNDYAKYALHLQACKYTGRGLLYRTEIKDIYARITQEDLKHSMPTVSQTTLFTKMPPQLHEIVSNSRCYKIECCDNDGTYKVITNDVYGENFITAGGIMAYSKKYKLIPKLVDFLGACEHDIHYKMWIETLFYPGQIIVYSGHSIWRKTKDMVLTKILMSSMIVSYGQIVTVTSIMKA